MTYNAEGKRTSLENLAGQVTTTAWDGWFVTYNGENRPVLWQCVSTNSPTPNSSTPTLISMSFDRMGRRVMKNDQRFVYDGYLQIANFEHQTSNIKLQTFIWDPTEPVATRPLVWITPATNHQSPTTSFYTHDGNKNVSEVVAENGGVAAHYEYMPFGAVAVLRGASASNNPWRFSSEFAEDDTATVYYNYRHYNPISKWLTREPLRHFLPNLYCICNVLSSFGQMCDTGISSWQFWAYSALTTLDCASAPVAMVLGGLVGEAVYPAGGGVIGAIIGATPAGDAVIDVAAMALQNMVSQGTPLPMSQGKSCCNLIMTAVSELWGFEDSAGCECQKCSNP